VPHSRRTLFARVALTVLVSTGVLVAFPAAPAHAACSTSEDNVIWIFLKDGVQRVLHSQGERTDIKIVNRDLNSDCTGFVTGSTTLEIFTSTGSDWAEAGWQKMANGSFKWFVEYGVNFASQARPEGSFPCTANVGDFPVFRVNEVPLNSGKWAFTMSCNGGSSWNTLTSDWDTNGTEVEGRPTVEVWRFGGDSTGMSDTHRNTKWKNSSGSFVANVGFICWGEAGSPNWHGHQVDPTTWETLKNSGSSC
jgi:hypothetical protein